ncbi:unnamed protein product [Sphenostylis stenocarpa]|uniref:Disease resistance RPP13-like protein 1 n=1 Tax=Sphenostylis stenocarpa TaxID=92480 RepID=A0AA86W415_9FABA|nr:unnamed protein product [Sphenostylis stenocarpa]
MVLELVGGALLSVFLEVAIDRLASRQVVDFFRGRKLDQTLLSKLGIKLQSIDAVADDAEQKQFKDARVKVWLGAVKNAVFDAEDILDEIEYELSKCKPEDESESQTFTGCTCKVPNLCKSYSLCSFNKEIKSRMEQVLDRLEFLSNQKGDLGLKKASGVGSGSRSWSTVSQKLPSTSLIVESVVYGRDDDKKMIFHWLTSDSDNGNQLSILSIVGMGGLGRTTLAQHVYNDPRIEDKFDIKAWVCVSDQFDVFEITRTILEAITKSTDDSRDLEMVHGRLKEQLTSKKFLLVLDDVWNEKQKKWELVLTPLKFGAQGCKIIVTTRHMNVASTVGSNKIHSLSELRGDHCWQLLATHAFRNDNPQPTLERKEIGMKIVEKCAGLPLALTTIGSLLNKKSSVSEWERILKSEIWDFPEEDSDIVPALKLSYHHLPSHLKRCFAYCALFPKNYVFDKEYLIQLWMAENFLHCGQQTKSPEELGEEYFNNLLSRSFFQQSSITSKSCFVMHDLLNNLANYVCGDICFRLEIDKQKNIPTTACHISVAINHVRSFGGFQTSCDTKRFRTFMPTSENMNFLNERWYCKMSIQSLFSKFKSLRVLSLSHCSNLTEVPDTVGNLKHLRSLDLSNTDINNIPETTCSLYNLQILKLNNCTNLKELPSNLHKLTNLRRLELIDTLLKKVPPNLGKLKNLQVLMSRFDADKSKELGIQQLRELNLHGSLSIGELQNIENPSDALAVDLKNKTRLLDLKLNWGLEENPDDSAKERYATVLDNLQPSKHLEKLSIKNYGGTRLPSWLNDNSLSKVVCLVLDSCKSCACWPPVGLLPLLKDLEITKLNGIKSIDADFYGSCSSSFSSLETLKFSFMGEWEKWECQAVTNAFPCLQILSIWNCRKLKGNLPDKLLHLKMLDINRCHQLVSFLPVAPEISVLKLCHIGKLQLDYQPANLKQLTIGGHNIEASLLERTGQIISDTSLERLFIYSSPEMNIPMSCFNHFLTCLKISDGCADQKKKKNK